MVSRGVNSPGDAHARSAEEIDFAQAFRCARETRCPAASGAAPWANTRAAPPARTAARSYRSSRRYPRTTRPVAVVHGALPSASWAARSSPTSSSSARCRDLRRLEEFVVLQRVAHGLAGRSCTSGTSGPGFSLSIDALQVRQPGFQLGTVGGGNLDTDPRGLVLMAGWAKSAAAASSTPGNNTDSLFILALIILRQQRTRSAHIIE